MRSRTDGMQQPQASMGTVGGRQGRLASSSRGGGYPDICTAKEAGIAAGAAAADSRLEDLRGLGISDRWIRIARTIGVDAFLAMWQILDEDSDDASGARVRVPLYASWQRCQRNRYIVALAQAGLHAREIRRRLQRENCGSISERHIARIIATARRAVE